MASAVDFKELLPEHLTSSQLIIDYLNSVGGLLNADIDKVSGIYDLINPNKVPVTYIQKLADLLNLSVYGADTKTTAQLRNQLIQAVDNYKIKGTYQSLVNAAYVFGLHANIKDFYTSGYSTFVPEDWFVGDINSNPSPLGSNYFKSPHFGVYFLLDTAKLNPNPPSSLSQYYLWKSADSTDFRAYVEAIRPITTVPHYYLQMNPICNESKVYQTVSGNIKTTVTNNWTYSDVFFDNSLLFDNSVLFDTSLSAFLSSITTWKLGTGNVGGTPLAAWTNLGSVAVTGTGITYIQGDSYFQFDFDVPISTVQAGVTELGLFTGGGSLVLAATFPSVDKDTSAIWHITIRVNKGS